MSNFIQKSFSNSKYFAFGIKDMDMVYSKTAIRKRQFNNSEIYVVNYDVQANIKSCIVFARSSYINLVSIVGIFSGKDHVAEDLKSAIKYLKEQIGKDVTKIRFSFLKKIAL